MGEIRILNSVIGSVFNTQYTWKQGRLCPTSRLPLQSQWSDKPEELDYLPGDDSIKNNRLFQ